MSQKSKDAETGKEFTLQIEKLREDKRRLKLELEIKENQIRTLKQYNEQLKQQQTSENKLA